MVKKTFSYKRDLRKKSGFRIVIFLHVMASCVETFWFCSLTLNTVTLPKLQIRSDD